MFGFGIPLEKAVPEGGVISESWCSWDAVFWEGMQSWQENVENHGVLGTRSSSIPCPGDAGIPVLELEHSAPRTNLKTGNQAVIKPKSSAGLHPKTFPGLRPHRSCSQQILPSSAPCSWPVFILTWIYFVSDHQQTAPHA